MPQTDTTPRLLITAGPTYEPIDAVRFIGNRSSGRLGSAVADYAASHGWDVTLLLGPNAVAPTNESINLIRFQSTSDLESLLHTHLESADTLIMAAAVADYRPAACEVDLNSKRKRAGGDVSIQLESTPDLLASCSERSKPDQLLIGFALEPRDRLIESALGKLERKNIDLIVANALDTMDADSIEATLIGNPKRGIDCQHQTDGLIPKSQFAQWLIDLITPLATQRAAQRLGNSAHQSSTTQMEPVNHD